jgi:hypothetical protein
MPVIPQYRARLRKVIGGLPSVADAFIQKHIRFIDHPPLSDGKDISVEEILKRVAEAVMRDDIRLVIIDPWNEIEHARDPAENISDYTGRSIRAMRHAAQQHKLSWIVVAHPTKEHAKGFRRTADKLEEGALPATPIPTLYDIEGCYSDDTEVLTHRGFVHHGQLTKSDNVACFDRTTEKISYQRPMRIIRREHDGEMLNPRGYSFDLLVTPEHRMVIKPPDAKTWELVAANKLPPDIVTLPLAGAPEAGCVAKLSWIVVVAHPTKEHAKSRGKRDTQAVRELLAIDIGPSHDDVLEDADLERPTIFHCEAKNAVGHRLSGNIGSRGFLRLMLIAAPHGVLVGPVGRVARLVSGRRCTLDARLENSQAGGPCPLGFSYRRRAPSGQNVCPVDCPVENGPSGQEWRSPFPWIGHQLSGALGNIESQAVALLAFNRIIVLFDQEHVALDPGVDHFATLLVGFVAVMALYDLPSCAIGRVVGIAVALPVG